MAVDSVYDMIDEIHQLVDKFIARCDVVFPSKLGLDPRSAACLYVTADAIACDLRDDGNLQYYGGFDQIDDLIDTRMVVGEYAIYLRTDDNRIDGILENYKGKSQ